MSVGLRTGNARLYADAHSNIGLSLERGSNNNYGVLSEAIAHLQEAHRVIPSHIGTYSTLYIH